MDKPNVFKTSGFYMAAGDVMSVSLKRFYGSALYISLDDADGASEDSETVPDVSSNMVSTWTNVSYNTFSSSGADITSAITDGASVRTARTTVIGGYGPGVYRLSYNLEVTSGDAPYVYLQVSGAAASNQETLVAGSNYVDLTLTVAAGFRLLIGNETVASEWSLSDVVLTPFLDIYYSLAATGSGTHFLTVGMDASSSASFSLRYYITRTGTRMMDWMQGLGIGWISLMGDEIWKHNSDNVSRCNFFGEQKNMVVGLVFNKDAGVIKILDSMEIHSDGEWVVDSIELPATLNYPDGMYSKIPQGKFRNREGVLYAEFLRNMKSKSGTISAIQALKGEPLRGDAAYMVLRNTSTDEVSLFKVRINATTGR